MKHFIYLSLLIFSFCIPSIHTTYAQEETSNVSNIELSQPTFEDKIYQKGDVIGVKFSIINTDAVDYTNMSVVTSLVVYSKDGGSKQYGYQNSLSDLFIPKNNTKELSFNYRYPDGVSSSVDDVVRLEMSLKKKTGETYGNIGNFIKIVSIQNPAELVDAFLATSEYEYTLQEGPTLNPDETAQINTVFINNSEQDIELHPVLKVYESEVTQNIFETKTYDSLTLGTTSEFTRFTLDLPVIQKAGVYQGELSFTDTTGLNQAPVLYVRWIVGGDFAKISDVSINATTFKKGDVATVDVVYTGPPVDIDTGETRDVGMGSIRVNLYNEKDELVGTGEQPANFSVIQGTTQLQIPLTKKATSIKATVSALKNGVELSTYTVNLTNPDDVPKENKLTSLLGLFAVLIVLILIISFMYKKKLHKKLVVMGLFSLIFLGGMEVGEAARACTADNDFCATVSLEGGSVYTPGANMDHSFSVQTEAYACTNQGGVTNVDWKVNGVAGSMINRYSKTAAASAEEANPTGPCGRTGCNIAAWFHDEVTRTIGKFSPATSDVPRTPITAPDAPGTYNLSVEVSNTARYKDGGTSLAFAKGPLKFNFTITVACSAGQTWNGSSCVTPVPPTVVNGACNNSTVWACHAGGGADSGADEGWRWTWRCTGLNGGSPAYCALAKPPQPVNGSCNNTEQWSCYSGAKADSGVDESTRWTWRCPGLNGGTNDYCALSKPVNGSCGGTIWSCTAGTADSGNDKTTNITWRCAGAYGGTNASCSLPKPPKPSNITASCPADSIKATISWTNPTGYNTILFRAYSYTAKKDFSWNENYVGSSIQIPVTPGHSYGSWIHTRNTTTNAYSDATAVNFMCPLPPPPINATAKCSVDTASQAFFSWTNPTGYTSANIRMIDTTATGVTTPKPHPQLRYLNGAVGTSATLTTIPGHRYLWWMHTAGKNSESTLVQGTFTCGTAIEGICSSTRNTCIGGELPTGYKEVGSKAYWYCPGSKGGKTASCEAPLSGNSSGLSCEISDSTPSLNQDVTYTAKLNPVDSGATYKWYIGRNSDSSIVSTNNPYTTKFMNTDSLPDSYYRTVVAKKTGGAEVTATCNLASVTCGNKPKDGLCVAGFKTVHKCGPTGYYTVNEPCGGDTAKTPSGTFSFDPKIVNSNQQCPLFLDITDAVKCTLNNGLHTPTVLEAGDLTVATRKITQNGGMSLPIGTYTLECVGSGLPAVTHTLGTLSCYSKPDVLED